MKPGTFASIYLTVHVCIAVLIKDEKQWINGSDFTLRACSRKPPQYKALYFDHWYAPSWTESSFILHNHKWIPELCHPHHRPIPRQSPTAGPLPTIISFSLRKKESGCGCVRGPATEDSRMCHLFIYLFVSY